MTMIDPAEIAHLNMVLHHLRKADDKLSAHIEDQDQDYKDLQKYMACAKNELDKYEMYHVRQTLSMIDKHGYAQVMERDRVRKLIESPYFGRFDFVYQGDDPNEAQIF